MYEQYTDKQIVEMLVPKLNKSVPEVNWRTELFYNDELIKALSIVYRSGYIRGQLGRSFIIGEPKQTEHWVRATKNNVKIGSKVRMVDEKGHRSNPWRFPDVGTVGTVIEVGTHIHLVQWPKGSTGRTDEWYCDNTLLEVLLCE